MILLCISYRNVNIVKRHRPNGPHSLIEILKISAHLTISIPTTTSIKPMLTPLKIRSPLSNHCAIPIACRPFIVGACTCRLASTATAAATSTLMLLVGRGPLVLQSQILRNKHNQLPEFNHALAPKPARNQLSRLFEYALDQSTTTALPPPDAR